MILWWKVKETDFFPTARLSLCVGGRCPHPIKRLHTKVRCRLPKFIRPGQLPIDVLVLHTMHVFRQVLHTRLACLYILLSSCGCKPFGGYLKLLFLCLLITSCRVCLPIAETTRTWNTEVAWPSFAFVLYLFKRFVGKNFVQCIDISWLFLKRCRKFFSTISGLTKKTTKPTVIGESFGRNLTNSSSSTIKTAICNFFNCLENIETFIFRFSELGPHVNKSFKRISSSKFISKCYFLSP